MDRAKVLDLVYRVIAELNEDLDGDGKLILSESTALFGPDSSLSSLGLVNLIVGIEESVSEQMGIEISLTSDETLPRAGSQTSKTSGPFRTIGTLVDHITTLLGEKNGCKRV